MTRVPGRWRMGNSAVLLAALAPFLFPAPGEAARQRFLAYVVAEYSRPRGRTVYVVSQAFGYCEGPGTNNLRSLERQAMVEVEQLAAQGQIVRPSDGTLRVSVHGAYRNEAEVERGRQFYIKRGASTYRTGFDAIYYPARMCDW